MKICKNITKKDVWMLPKFLYLCPLNRAKFFIKMKVKVLIGEIEEFEASTNEEIVLKLKNGGMGFTAHQSIQKYMLEYAIRAVHWNNSDIRATDVDSFVEDLVKYKHIQIMDSQPN